MSFLNTLGRRLKRSFQALSVTDEKAWNPSLWNLLGSQSVSGETVTEHTALTYSAVFNAISLISGTIAALPLHLMQKRGEAKRVADDRKVYGVLHDQWNPWMTAMAGRECLMAHVLAWGNGYCEIVRDGFGEVTQLWPITPERVRPSVEGGELVYYVKVDGPERRFPRSRIFHLPGLGFDGLMGYSVVSLARKSFGLGMAIETFGALYFGQGTHPGVAVTHPGRLTDQGHKNLSTSLADSYAGLGKSHRLMLLEEGMKVEKLGVPPNDSQFLESRQFQVAEIARWFNLPPHKLKDLTRSSFNNIESEQRSFYVDSVLPWLVRLEQNYNLQLLTPSDKFYTGRGRLYFKHSPEGILRGDAAARGQFYKDLFGIGALSVNEIRALEDLDPVDGGDIHLVPLNMIPLELAGEEEPEPPTQEPPVADDPEEAEPERSEEGSAEE